MPNVRLIGGSHAGETIQWDLAKQGPVIRLADMTDCDFPRPCDVDTTLPQTVPVEVYTVERIAYPSGHTHHYGILSQGWLVGSMNQMWNGYQESLKNDRR